MSLGQGGLVHHIQHDGHGALGHGGCSEVDETLLVVLQGVLLLLGQHQSLHILQTGPFAFYVESETALVQLFVVFGFEYVSRGGEVVLEIDGT